jgi:hypothetical protein
MKISHFKKTKRYFKNMSEIKNYLEATRISFFDELNNVILPLYKDNEMEFDEIPTNSRYDDKLLFRVKDKIVRTENDYGDNFRANGEEVCKTAFDTARSIWYC